jgi:DNA-binding response OmpR family regulator
LTKPFSFEVRWLAAPPRAGRGRAGLRLRFSDLAIDPETQGGVQRLLNLTRTEFSILECLLRSADAWCQTTAD